MSDNIKNNSAVERALLNGITIITSIFKAYLNRNTVFAGIHFLNAKPALKIKKRLVRKLLNTQMYYLYH